MIVTFVLGSLQGRVGAFDKATNDVGPQLINQLCVFEPDFKTSLQYGLQPITTSTTSTELLKMYLEHVRPKVMQGDKDLLFISLNGCSIRVGRCVSAFFKRICGLNITTTTVRSIIATESACLLQQNKISLEEQMSVQNINGHNGITAQKYYQKRSRIKDTENASSVHKKLLRLSDSYNNTTVDDESSLINAPSCNLVENSLLTPANECDAYSTNTELYTDSTLSTNTEVLRRVPWTDKEISIVGTWCKSYRKEHPFTTNVVSKCLNYIRSSSVKTYFHPHHIADSARLRWGWQKFQEQDREANC